MSANIFDLNHLSEDDRNHINQYTNSKSDAMKEVFAELKLYAPSELPVVVEGESGTGKEMFVMALHSLSKHHTGPFVAVNMGEGPDSLFESALFGHRKGAFTGADQARSGYFEQANEGTLFLDEINSLNKNLQPKLLRVLETRSYRPLGSSRVEKSTARFVFSSNESLEKISHEGRFRSDLFFRMGRVIRLPPLRERKEDIPYLVNDLLRHAEKTIGEAKIKINEKINHRKISGTDMIPIVAKVGPGSLERLQSYSWPGNIRQLKQVLERAFLMSEDGKILPEHLALPYEDIKLQGFGKAMEEFEESYFNEVFAVAGHNVRIGLRLTGMSETSYRRKLRKYGKKKFNYLD